MKFKEWFYQNEVFNEPAPLQRGMAQTGAQQEFNQKAQAIQKVLEAIGVLDEGIAQGRHVSAPQIQSPQTGEAQRLVTAAYNFFKQLEQTNPQLAPSIRNISGAILQWQRNAGQGNIQDLRNGLSSLVMNPIMGMANDPLWHPVINYLKTKPEWAEKLKAA